MMGGCWGAEKGGIVEVEGGRLDDDEGGAMAADNHMRRMVGVLGPKASTGNEGVRERKSGRGRELTIGSSIPHGLSTAASDNETDGDVITNVPIVVSAVGAAPTGPAVEFREVGAGAS